MHKSGTFGVPRIQSLMWSQAALAADSELDCFRALITAAPRCCTVTTNSSLNLRYQLPSHREASSVRHSRQPMYSCAHDPCLLTTELIRRGGSITISRRRRAP